MTKVALVVQRFGPSIVGGAESHAWMIARHLKKVALWDVEVFTTTATDYRTWENSLPSGEVDLDGIRVFRFSTVLRRMPWVMAIVFFCLRLCRKTFGFVPAWLEWLWLVAQGPYSPILTKTLLKKQSDYDAAIFFTYLYFPTVVTLPKLTIPTVLVPTAHDELPFYFGMVGRLMASATYLAVNTDAEARLICRAHGVMGPKMRTVGLGFSPGPAGTAPIPDRFILYLGRIGRAKSADELIDYFLRYAPSELILVLAGKVESDIQVPDHPRIRFVGFLDESQKWQYIHHALALVNPSRFESLSMVAIEGMATSKPLLLSAHCEVFREYGKNCPSVRTYRNEEDFCKKLAEIEETDWDSTTAAQQLESSRRWALENYTWEVVLKKYADMVQGKNSSATI